MPMRRAPPSSFFKSSIRYHATCSGPRARAREDVQALKRLQRDAFEQLLRLDERVDAALGDGDAEPGARAGAAPGAGSAASGGGGGGRAGARVSGALAAGAALLSLQARRRWA